MANRNPNQKGLMPAWKPGQSGNPSGRPHTKPISDRYAYVAEETLPETPQATVTHGASKGGVAPARAARDTFGPIWQWQPEGIRGGAREIGLRLSAKAPKVGELRRLIIPVEAPKEIQLELVEATPSLADAADSDLAEATDEGASSREQEEEEEPEA